jgi:hypothetical protein
MTQASSLPSRREFLTICGGIGVVSSFFVGALYALAATTRSEPISPDIIDQAAELAGITILPEQKQAMLSQLRDQRNSIVKVRAVHLPNDVPPAFRFDPLLGLDCRFGSDVRIERAAKAISPTPAIANQPIPSNLEELAFATVRELGELIRQRKVSSVALTEMYLARLKRFDSKLHCTITLTEERAMEQGRLTKRSPKVITGDPYMEFRGGRKISWLSGVIQRHGVLAGSRINRSMKTPLS